MASAGRIAAVITVLAALAAAAPFAPGTRFGTVGLDRGYTTAFEPGPHYDHTPFATLDPYLRTGIGVLPDLAVGAELALLNTLPGGSWYDDVPVLAFGPSATFHLLPDADVVRPYLAAGVGATYGFVWRDVGWRVRLGAGATLVSWSPVMLGVEAGWYGDWYQEIAWDTARRVWFRGDTGFFGIRLMALRS